MAFLFILRYTELKCKCNQMYSVFEVYVLKKREMRLSQLWMGQQD